MKFLHCFADCGVEGEALAPYGEVHRYSINPRENPVNEEVVQMDLLKETPPDGYNLGLFHPVCSKWSDMPGVDPDDHIDMIPRAREIAEECCEHYIIENKPRAPLQNPTKLDGKMFGLPIEYERAFETSFRVEQPPRQQALPTETSPFFYSERTTEWWKAVKGIRGDYPKEHVAKNALPLAYVDFIVRNWLRETEQHQGVGDYQDYDAEMDEKRRREANTSILSSVGER